jgi:hypothetical protein
MKYITISSRINCRTLLEIQGHYEHNERHDEHDVNDVIVVAVV